MQHKIRHSSFLLVATLLGNGTAVVPIPPTDDYLYFDDGLVYWRKGVRDSYFVVDKSPTGNWSGDEGGNWTNVKMTT